MLRTVGTIAVLLAVAGVTIGIVAGGNSDGPTQPIAFSHKIHAGDNQIGCLYCHTYARRSTVAGVPSVQLCMGCHRNVGQDKPEVQKLAAYWDQRVSIPWARVYDMPDFVYFSHKRHVLKKIPCQECHGPVQTMSTVKRVGTLDMARCVNCHVKNRASIDCLTCHK
jgi:hypothetical protein